jgi:hypothetical protein
MRRAEVLAYGFVSSSGLCYLCCLPFIGLFCLPHHGGSAIVPPSSTIDVALI